MALLPPSTTRSIKPLEDCVRIAHGVVSAERQGQQREPATGDARNATRRAGWRPFAGSTGSTLLMSTGRSTRCSRLPMRHVKSLFSTGWQDGQDGSGPRRRTCSSCHPVILSDLSRDAPVLDSGFWVVEREGQPPKPSPTTSASRLSVPAGADWMDPSG
jgi:hypothetical protein